MLPPVDKAVLLANPQFEILYNSLCLSKLDPNGTSRLDDKTTAEYHNFEQELLQARIKTAKRDLLVHCLTTISDGAEVSAELQEVATIVAAILNNGSVASEDMSIVFETLHSFKGHLSDIAAPIATRLHNHADVLIGFLSPSSSPTNDLSKGLSVLKQYKEALQHSQASLAKHQMLTIDLSAQLHNDYRKIIESCVSVLEQTVHGSESRAVKAKVDYLATVAEGMSKKAGVQQNQLLAHLETPEAQARLRKALVVMKNDNRLLHRQCLHAETEVETLQAIDSTRDRAQHVMSMIDEMHKLEAEISMLKA